MRKVDGPNNNRPDYNPEHYETFGSGVQEGRTFKSTIEKAHTYTANKAMSLFNKIKNTKKSFGKLFKTTPASPVTDSPVLPTSVTDVFKKGSTESTLSNREKFNKINSNLAKTDQLLDKLTHKKNVEEDKIRSLPNSDVSQLIPGSRLAKIDTLLEKATSSKTIFQDELKIIKMNIQREEKQFMTDLLNKDENTPLDNLNAHWTSSYERNQSTIKEFNELKPKLSEEDLTHLDDFLLYSQTLNENFEKLDALLRDFSEDSRPETERLNKEVLSNWDSMTSNVLEMAYVIERAKLKG